MKEDFSEFFTLILDFKDDDEDLYYEIDESSKKESVKNDLIILEKDIHKACKFWKRNVFLTLSPKDELWSQAIDTFKVFDLVDTFSHSLKNLKSSALNENQDLYLMLTKSKEFIKKVEDFTDVISLLRMIPLNDIRKLGVRRFQGDTFPLNLAPWYFKYHKLPITFLETLAENWGTISNGNYKKIQTKILNNIEEDYFYDPEDSCHEEISDRGSMYHILIELQDDEKLLKLIRTRYKEIQNNKKNTYIPIKFSLPSSV